VGNRIAATEARSEFAALVNTVAYGRQRVVLERRGRTTQAEEITRRLGAEAETAQEKLPILLRDDSD
jgi:hypothetical protein